MSDSSKTNAVFQQNHYFSNSRLRIRCSEMSKSLIVLSKAIQPNNPDSPEQHVLWKAISQIEDMEGHFESLNDKDFHDSVVNPANEELEPLSSFDLQIKLKILSDKQETALNSLSKDASDVPEVAVLIEVANELCDLEKLYSRLEGQRKEKDILEFRHLYSQLDNDDKARAYGALDGVKAKSVERATTCKELKQEIKKQIKALPRDGLLRVAGATSIIAKDYTGAKS